MDVRKCLYSISEILKTHIFHKTYTAVSEIKFRFDRKPTCKSARIFQESRKSYIQQI